MSDLLPADMWRVVSGKGEAIAGHLRNLVPVLPRAIGQRVTRVARKLEDFDKRSVMVDSNLQQRTFADFDLVAIVSPLLERARVDQEDNVLTDAELYSDLQLGVCRLVRGSPRGSNVVGILTYPGLLLVGVIGVTLLFSLLVLPNFRTLIGEFGVEVPGSTKLIFSIGSFIESAWPLLLFVAAVAALPMVVDLCRCLGVATGVAQWVDDKFSSKRSVLAVWARHTALLLQVGVGVDSAVESSKLPAKS